MAATANPLPRTDPASAGISPASIPAFTNALEANGGGPHSFMLLRHGKVAAEGWWRPYAPHRPHMLFSLSKSFTSTAVGFAVSEGLLTVDDPVISFFLERLPAVVPPSLEDMRVRHLLSMSTGHDVDATGRSTEAADGDWVRAFLALPVENRPGTKFVYNSAATYMCSAIVQSLTGKTVLEYLTPRLFEPLGIRKPTWESCPRGINVGGWGLSVKTEDIARFGLCYLNRGAWNGRQIVPADWVKQATSKQVENGDDPNSDWTQGYGFQFWRCRHGAYRGDGAFGQFCVVMPEQDAVLAVTSGTGDLQAVLNAAWDHLLPGMETVRKADDTLKARLDALEIPVPAGAPTSETANRVSGKAFFLEPNELGFEKAVFTFMEGGASLELAGSDFGYTLPAGTDEWREGEITGPPVVRGLLRSGKPPTGKVATKVTWTDAATCTLTVCYVEAPFVETVTCRFTGDTVTVNRVMNVGFEPLKRDALVGRLG